MIKTKPSIGKKKVVLILLALLLIIGLLIWIFAIRPENASNHKGNNAEIKQPSNCVNVEVIAIPGTGGSKLGEDPLHPSFDPKGTMNLITTPLTKMYDNSKAEIYTIPYPAQIGDLLGQKSPETFDQSLQIGENATLARINEVHKQCPKTNFAFVGYSQGADIAGDIANMISLNKIPGVTDNNVLFVGLLADPRRVAGQGQSVGVDPKNNGIEVAMQGFSVPGNSIIPQLRGITLRGPRQGGFNGLNDKVFNICAPNDLICDCPQLSLDLFGSLPSFFSGMAPIHGSYMTTKYWNLNGESATIWLEKKLEEIINTAPDTHN